MLSIFAFLALGGLGYAAPPPYQQNGAFATANSGGFGFNPFAAMLPMDPWAMVNNFMPPIRIPQPWYQGENVCQDTRTAEEPEELREWLNDGSSSGGDSQFNVQQESCKGGNEKYVCIKRVGSNEGSRTIVTKFECCPGYGRPADFSQPGCVPVGDQSGNMP
ncbi:uncharacterized protein LOC129222410 [Uloborus diversus]|uniref:uncharacterized protein LOC129222410 n=1 Tax=Uloborus diversus TaxID=327109 RepID=UPI002409DF07|nr:uncharacterized protein LOC129222410 [Uloborus diversus]